MTLTKNFSFFLVFLPRLRPETNFNAVAPARSIEDAYEIVKAVGGRIERKTIILN